MFYALRLTAYCSVLLPSRIQAAKTLCTKTFHTQISVQTNHTKIIMDKDKLSKALLSTWRTLKASHGTQEPAPKRNGEQAGEGNKWGWAQPHGPQPSQPMLIHPKPQTQGLLALLKGWLSPWLHPKSNLHSNINKMLCWGKKGNYSKNIQRWSENLKQKGCEKVSGFAQAKGWLGFSLRISGTKRVSFLTTSQHMINIYF